MTPALQPYLDRSSFVDPLEAIEVLSCALQHRRGIARDASRPRSIQPERAHLFPRQLVTLPQRVDIFPAHAAMHRRAFAREASAIAEVNDVLAGYAKHSRGLSRGNQFWNLFHERSLPYKHQKHHAPVIGSVSPKPNTMLDASIRGGFSGRAAGTRFAGPLAR